MSREKQAQIRFHLFRFFYVISLSLFLLSCSKKETEILLVPVNTLDYYVKENEHLEKDILIACAASEMPDNTEFNVSLFFYPIEGVNEILVFESDKDDINPEDYTQYTKKQTYYALPVFNAYLRRFPFTYGVKEPWAIMTYKTEGKIHICDPIKMKQNSKPTVYAPQLIEIDLSSPTEPIFSWEADTDSETVIYFQVVTDTLGNLISGTYTYDKHWQFYDLSNVVLNIHDVSPPPELSPNTKYKFTLMGVSEDNWVNLAGEKEFITE